MSKDKSDDGKSNLMEIIKQKEKENVTLKQISALKFI